MRFSLGSAQGEAHPATFRGRSRDHAIRPAALLLLIPLVLMTVDCSSNTSTSTTNPTATTRPAAAATTAPTVGASPTQAAAAFNPAKLPPALMAMDRVQALIGSNVQTLRDKVTDPSLPFSSAPAIAGTLTAQQVSLLYNSFQAGAQPATGRPFAAQNTVQGYPSAANATTVFAALRTTWQGTLFQNLSQQQPPNGWQEAFCQLGNFTTTGGQAQQWYVCMARSGLYIVTVSVGGFPGLDVNSVAQVVRAYFDDALRAVQ